MWGRQQMLRELQDKYKVEEVHGLMLTNDKGEKHFFVFFSDKGDVPPERHWENPETTTIITIHRE